MMMSGYYQYYADLHAPSIEYFLFYVSVFYSCVAIYYWTLASVDEVSSVPLWVIQGPTKFAFWQIFQRRELKRFY